MFSGQKVITVFFHEGQVKEHVAALNEKLCDSAAKANEYANPIS